MKNIANYDNIKMVINIHFKGGFSMKKLSQKIISILLAIIMITSSISISFSVFANAGDSTLDSNGIFHRYSEGILLDFDTNYDNIVDTVRQAFLNHKDKVSVSFAVSENSSYNQFYYYYEEDGINDEQERANAVNACEKLLTSIFYDAFKERENSNELFDGEYLYHSIMMTNLDSDNFETGYIYLPTKDTDIINGERYATIRIDFSNLNYYTTLEQEADIKGAIKDFNIAYIKSGYTDYQKVKIIYDFVVRNIKYDYDTSKTHRTETDLPDNVSLEQYLNSHSAYGALFGKGNYSTFELKSKTNIIGDKVLYNADQGLAVCEGFSKLFYLLCKSNKIPCRIIDGDYTQESGKNTDAHEWNCVYLKDESPNAQYKWYWVDTTFASQSSLKELDFNNYDYFLRGKSTGEFAQDSHPQPYHFYRGNLGGDKDIKPQLYDWYGEQTSTTVCIGSDEDYLFNSPSFSDLITTNTNVMICRSYILNGEEKGAYILTNGDETTSIQIDEDGVITKNKDLAGFIFNNQDCTFTVSIPYVVNGDKVIDKSISKNWRNASDNYKIEIEGKNDTKITIPFKVLGHDMGVLIHGDEIDQKIYSSITVDNHSSYTGKQIIPTATILDGYKNELVEGRDYLIQIYSEPTHSPESLVNEIKNMGTYYIDIKYQGNYNGHYYITYSVGKIDLAKISVSEATPFQYYPKSLRLQNNIETPYDYVKSVTSKGLVIGDYTIKNDIDYDITINGNVEYGDTGSIEMVGKDSPLVVAGSKTTYNYVVNRKYNLEDSGLDGSWAENPKNAETFTGKPICPKSFSVLDQYFEQGIDYEIVGYGNNINPSTNEKTATVTIRGINGCEGEITLKFAIIDKRTDITTLKLNTVGSTASAFKYSITDGNYTLKKGVDYTESYKLSGTTPVVVIKGIGNYVGSTEISLSGAYGPTSSGNYITLSYASTTYTGKALKPTVKVYNKNKKQIISNLYTVSYSANTNVGIAKVTVKFLTGQPSITKTFIINPKGTTLSKLTPASKSMKVTWKKYTTQTTGYQIQYSTSSKFTKPTTVTISKNSTVSTTIKKLTKGKKYYFRIRTYRSTGGKKYYSAWSKALSAKAK